MSALQKQTNASGNMWLLLWSLLLGGVNVRLGDRAPVVLYFDVVLVLWLVYYVLGKGFWPSFSGWIMRLGIFCILSGMFSAIVNYEDAYKSLAVIKIFACGLLVYAIARKAPPSILILSLWGAAVGVLLLINYQRVRYGVYESEEEMKGVLEIPLGRSNYVASILLLLIPLAVAAFSLYKGRTRLLFAGCAMLMFAGLIATMSRGAMMAIFLAMVLSLPLLFRAGMRAKHALLALGLGGLLLFLLPFDLLVTDASLVFDRLVNPDLSRQELMKASWESFKDNPVLGVGPGQLGHAIAHHMQVPDYDPQYVNAHNLVLNALAENGLIAGLGLLAMFGIVLRKAWRAASAHSTALNVALWVGLLAAVIHNMVEASFEGQQFQVVFWIVAAMSEMDHAHLQVSMKTVA